MEIAKKFSDETSGAFINGVLDKISKSEEEISIEGLETKESLETEEEDSNQDKESIETTDELHETDSNL